VVLGFARLALNSLALTPPTQDEAATKAASLVIPASIDGSEPSTDSAQRAAAHDVQAAASEEQEGGGEEEWGLTEEEAAKGTNNRRMEALLKIVKSEDGQQASPLPLHLQLLCVVPTSLRARSTPGGVRRGASSTLVIQGVRRVFPG
jgi:hypothetical protein